MTGEHAGLLISVFAAMGAAGTFGVAAALQHHQAGQAARNRKLSPRLLSDVARRPLWLAGMALAVVAYGLQALALAYGPLTLVAPIVAADMIFALPLAAHWSRRRLRGRDWAGCLLVAVGVGVFLAVAPPSAGRGNAPAADWIKVFGVVAVLAVVAVAASRLGGRATRAGLLAGAAGVIFGLTAAVTASFTRALRQDGLSSALIHWQPWVLVSLGIAGILLSTGAFQASVLSASLPIIDTVEPVSGVIMGAVLFDERVAASPGGMMVQVGAGVVAAAGIAMLGPSLAAVHQSPRAVQADPGGPADLSASADSVCLQDGGRPTDPGRLAAEAPQCDAGVAAGPGIRP